jgi:hypothetical protein
MDTVITNLEMAFSQEFELTEEVIATGPFEPFEPGWDGICWN